MSSTLDVFNEALQRASNPVNPPPPKPSTLDVSSPASPLAPSLARHWHSNGQFTPPNTAVESNHTQWHPPSPQLDDSPTFQSEQIWSVGSCPRRNPSKSISEAEADFHQQAMTCDEVSQMHNRNEYPSPTGANDNTAGEPPQSKASAVDDLFSNADDNEMPDSEEFAQDGNIFEMSGLEQQAQKPTEQNSTTSLQTIPGIMSHTPVHAALTDVYDFTDRASRPSPTESQLVAEGFEFHNQLTEEVQINRFNDKAFRKALREVQSDLPRKQQWYAWRKAKQMLNTEPESVATERVEKSWGKPRDQHDQTQNEYQHESEIPPTNHTATEQIENGIWSSPAQPVSLSTTTNGRSGKQGEENHAIGRSRLAQVPRPNTCSSPVSTGDFAVGQSNFYTSGEAQNHGDWATKPQKNDQDGLSSHPLGKLISNIAEEYRARRPSEDHDAAECIQEAHPSAPIARKQLNNNANANATAIATAEIAEVRSLQLELLKADKEVLSQMKEMKAKILPRRDGSPHGLFLVSNDNTADEQDRTMLDEEHVPTAPYRIWAPTAFPSLPKQRDSADAPPLPPRPTIERSTSHCSSNTSIHDADLLRPHTNTIIRRSLSPSQRHLPPAISPNRRSPSPWIEHPGINRPDTPRPSRPTSPRRSDIRQSVEPETSLSDRLKDRESTPIYSNRSPSPSPASHLGTSYTHHNAIAHQQEPQIHDTDMTDAPSPTGPPTATATATPPTHLFPQTSSPDPLSSPILHNANTVTAPTTPLPQSTPLHPPPIPPSTPLQPGKTRRKSIGGQPPSTSKSKPRNATGVQGSNITKSRNATRRVTQVAQKVVAKAKRETATATATETATAAQGSKVAQAVQKIEEGMKAGEGSSRRSGRLAGKKGGR